MKHEVRTRSVVADELLKRAMLLVEDINPLDGEASVKHGTADAIPNVLGRVHENEYEPVAGPQDAIALFKAFRHQFLVSAGVLFLDAIDDGLVCGFRVDPEPRFPQHVHLAVVDIGSEGWVGEDQVNGVIWQKR